MQRRARGSFTDSEEARRFATTRAALSSSVSPVTRLDCAGQISNPDCRTGQDLLPPFTRPARLTSAQREAKRLPDDETRRCC